MPKETRKKSTRDPSATRLSGGSRSERRIYEPHAPSMAIPQVTVTPEHGLSLEVPQEDRGPPLDGTLHRTRSCTSISSTGSSALESEDDLHSDSESKSRGIVTLEQVGDPCEVKQWSKLKGFVHWPFRSSLKRKVNWVQLAGHKGSFKSLGEGTILKKLSENERQCFEKLQEDTLLPFVPQYHGVVERDGQSFIHLDDLLVPFDQPSVMDCKMGVRTYLEEELVRAREHPRPREDLYKKMVEVDGEGPTAEEHSHGAVTKPRYMQWRETLSSTHTLGYRIEGIKKSDGTCRTDFKKTRLQQDIIKVFQDFVGGSIDIMQLYLSRLKEIQQALSKSHFFKQHEVIGSSLLFLHDISSKAQVWMIDFGKTTALAEGQLQHNVPWQEGNREDGYLWGLQNLIHTIEAAKESRSQNNQIVSRLCPLTIV
ncbi:inositol-trisphosphate 3-kinase A [Eucyclogobius newberryi]|uniref:inositol-trisphosphate 3-kinase A n=1 Tax=Eucyclogobius newberryi TaxID=166745 RepID=UPI003B592C3C